jgi:L-asparaginase
MVPYSIDPVEATANLSSAYGYINALEQEGVFIAMNGVMGPYEKIKKDRTKGRFSL